MIPLLSRHVTDSRLVSAPSVLGQLPWVPQALYASLYPPSIQHGVYTNSHNAYEHVVNTLLQMDLANPSFVLTSSCEGNSTSWVAMSLVYHLCRQGQRVLLVDGDFQSPTVHHAFDIALRDERHLTGLIARCRKEDSVSWEMIQDFLHANLGIPGLTVLHNGLASTPFPAERADFSVMMMLMEQCRPHFDWIVLDCAPILSSDEPVLLAKSVSGVLLLEDREATPQRLTDIYHRLQDDNLSCLGRIHRHTPG